MDIKEEVDGEFFQGEPSVVQDLNLHRESHKIREQIAELVKKKLHIEKHSHDEWINNSLISKLNRRLNLILAAQKRYKN